MSWTFTFNRKECEIEIRDGVVFVDVPDSGEKALPYFIQAAEKIGLLKATKLLVDRMVKDEEQEDDLFCSTERLELKCDSCGRTGLPMTTLTDHPDVHDGRYCDPCFTRLRGGD